MISFIPAFCIASIVRLISGAGLRASCLPSHATPSIP